MGVILVPPPIHRQTFASIYSHAGGRWIAKRHSVPFYLLFAFGMKEEKVTQARASAIDDSGDGSDPIDYHESIIPFLRLVL
jgi:hypothetical protein